MEAFNRAYLGGTDSENHAVSVGLCSGEQLRRLPRTLLVAAGRDILRDQGCELAEKSGGRIERVEFLMQCIFSSQCPDRMRLSGRLSI